MLVSLRPLDPPIGWPSCIFWLGPTRARESNVSCLIRGMHAWANGPLPFVSRPRSPEKKEGNNDIAPIIHIWLSSGIEAGAAHAMPQGGAKRSMWVVT